MYRVNINKIKTASTSMYLSDFRGKSWDDPYGETELGVYWDISEIPSTRLLDIPKGIYLYPPILLINEEIRDHMTQLIFIIKENCITKELGFTGWKEISKEILMNLCNEEGHIYRECPNGDEFVSEFPAKIDEFLSKYCDPVN